MRTRTNDQCACFCVSVIGLVPCPRFSKSILFSCAACKSSLYVCSGLTAPTALTWIAVCSMADAPDAHAKRRRVLQDRSLSLVQAEELLKALRREPVEQTAVGRKALSKTNLRSIELAERRVSFPMESAPDKAVELVYADAATLLEQFAGQFESFRDVLERTLTKYPSNVDSKWRLIVTRMLCAGMSSTREFRNGASATIQCICTRICPQYRKTSAALQAWLRLFGTR